MVHQCPLCGTPSRPLEILDKCEVLAFTANIPIALAKIVIKTCERHGFEHEAVRHDGRTPAMLAVRDKIVKTAVLRGYSISQLARALNRCRTSVRAAIKRVGV